MQDIAFFFVHAEYANPARPTIELNGITDVEISIGPRVYKSPLTGGELVKISPPEMSELDEIKAELKRREALRKAGSAE
jgi:hypothetical protein